jgi:hypothetical protein
MKRRAFRFQSAATNLSGSTAWLELAPRPPQTAVLLASSEHCRSSRWTLRANVGACEDVAGRAVASARPSASAVVPSTGGSGDATSWEPTVPTAAAGLGAAAGSFIVNAAG